MATDSRGRAQGAMNQRLKKVAQEKKERGALKSYSHESDAFSPGIRLDGGVLREAFRAKGLICRGEEMNESCGYDDTRAKILCDEEGRLGHLHTFGPSKHDGDDCTQETADQDHKDGTDAKAQAAIVLVAGV